MGASKPEIIKENEKYYFQTYAKTITRAHFWWSFGFIAVLFSTTIAIALGFLQLAYIKMAAQHTLDQDVITWVTDQMFGWRSIVIILILAAGGLVLLIWLWHYWKSVKSYDLYKKKWRFLIFPLLTVLIEIILVLLITRFLANDGIIAGKLNALALKEFGVLLVTLLPLWSGARLFVPWEITPLPQKEAEGWKRALNLLKMMIDFVSKLYLAGK